MRNLTLLRNHTNGGNIYQDFVKKQTGLKSSLQMLLKQNHVENISVQQEDDVIEKLRELSKNVPHITFSVLSEHHNGYKFFVGNGYDENNYLLLFNADNEKETRSVIYKITDGTIQTLLPRVEFK